MAQSTARQVQTSPFEYRKERHRERQIKREAVLRTAASLFCARGYHATQMSDVARELGVTKPTIYYYFKSKEDVLAACFDAGFKLLMNAGEEVDADNATGAQRLRAALIRYAELMTGELAQCTVRLSLGDLGARSRKRIAASRRKFDRHIRSLIEAAVADGSVAPCDPKIATFTVLGSLNWISQWYKPDGELSAEQVAAGVVDQLFRGLER